MATQVQLRRGNTAQISAFTGAIGEVTYDTDRQTLVTHDGVTVGGIPLSTESLAIAAFQRANTSNDVLLIAGVYDKANAANLLAYGTGIGANSYTDTVVLANVEIANAYYRTFANSVGTAANAYADSVGSAGNANLSVATVAANSYASSVGTSANNFAGAMANAANAYAASLTPDLSPVFLVANAAFDKANAANVLAYNALPKTGGTVSGDMVVTGNLTVSGETTYANTQTLLIGDNIFVVNADLPNDVAPSEDAGIEVNRGSSTDVSVKWNESTDKWTFTNDGSTFVNIASNTDITNVGTAANANLSVGTISANNFAGAMANAANAYAASLTPDLSPVFLVANAAFDKANAANVLACTAFDAANSKVASVTGTAGQIFSSGGNTPTLNLITTAVTSAIYGGSTQIPVINIDSYGRITSASNVAVQGMDYAYVNSSIDVANAYSRVFANSVGSAVNANLSIATVAANTYADGKLANTSGVVFAGDLNVTGNLTIDSTSFFLDKNANRVGIGTTSPSATLDVVGTLNTSKADILNQTLTDAASIAWDTALGQIATVTLGGNRALANASNLKVGTYILHVVQDGSGGRTLSYGSQYKWPGGVAPTLTTTIGARDLISFVSDGTLMYGSFLPDVK